MGLLSTLLKPLIAKLVEEIWDAIKDPEKQRAFAEKLLDMAEEFTAGTDATWDDSIVAGIRKLLNMPDLPD